jgi:hypothetical protein
MEFMATMGRVPTEDPTDEIKNRFKDSLNNAGAGVVVSEVTSILDFTPYAYGEFGA